MADNVEIDAVGILHGVLFLGAESDAKRLSDARRVIFDTLTARMGKPTNPPKAVDRG